MQPQVIRWLVVVGLAVAASPARAQQAAAVQLPTYSFFSVDTTVSVPDSGSVLLGGVSRGQDGQNEFGTPILPFRNQSISSSRSASSARVTVTVHDFAAMDEALLGEPASSFAEHHRSGPAGGDFPRHSPAELAGNWLPNGSQASGADPAATVADLVARRVAIRQTRADDAEKFFARARQAETDGKTSVARVYYQMAARRASGALKEQALARLQGLQGIQSAPATKIAQNRP